MLDDITRKRRRKSCLIIVLVIFFYTAISNTFAIIIWQKINPFITQTFGTTLESSTNRTSNLQPKTLENIIKNSIGNSWHNYSIIVSDLNSDFRVAVNDHIMYTAASLNKTIILAALYKKLQSNPEEFDRVLILQPDDIQDYGTGSIRYDPPGTAYTVKSLAIAMMKKSDNTAAYLIANYILTMDEIQSQAEAWNLKQSSLVDNKTTNADMELLFRKIYTGDIVSGPFQQEMLEMMTESDFEDRLPAKLPQNITIYHKVGSATGLIHDVGIVKSGKTQYYIGIMTSDITNESDTVNLIADVSKRVYDFMTGSEK